MLPPTQPNNQMGHGVGRGGTQASEGPSRLYSIIGRQNTNALNTIITCTLTVCNREVLIL